VSVARDEDRFLRVSESNQVVVIGINAVEGCRSYRIGNLDRFAADEFEKCLSGADRDVPTKLPPP